MKKIITLFAALLITIGGKAQDLALASPNGSITSPVSGCSLTTTEVVTVSIFNFGPTLPAGSTFNVSYTLNGGAPVTELVTLGANFLTNGSFVYSFTTTADLSVAGTYTLTATVSLAGDVNPANDTFSAYNVTNTAPSVGGTVTGPGNVCKNVNAGNLTLAGQTGNVLNWEFSTDGGTTFTLISNTTTSQPYNNLSVPTIYRAVVQSGTCPQAISTQASIVIDPTSVGGTVAGTATKCTGANAGTLTLSGKTGNVIKWQFSTNGGVSWTDIANVTSSQTYLNLVTTTKYRAVVQSGTCASANSSIATITISPNSVGGILAPLATTVCAGANGGTITLSGKVGAVKGWEFSTNGGVTFSPVAPANVTTSLTYTNLATTRMYRVKIQSSPCSITYSDTATVTVTAATVAGSVTANATVCSGANAGTLNLAGQTGSVLDWESSTDGGVTFTSLGNVTTSQVYTNVAVNTIFHAIVQAGACTPSTSSPATITVTAPSFGGTVSTNTTVCASGNNGTLTLAGQTGSVTNWLSSSDNGVTWSNVANTTTSQAFTNLADTTLFVAVVQNGACPKDSSDTVTVTVDPISAGGSVNTAASACFGNNSDTLLLTGNAGAVLNWESSTDNGLTWVSIVNATDSQAYSNLTVTTMYRSLVQSGVCASAYSTAAKITIDPTAVGGTLYGGTTECQSGNSGTMTLVGFNTTVANWESSIDGGVTWSPIANTTAFQNYLNLTQTTSFRSIVISGVCPNDTSSVATIQVDSVTVGGAVTINDTVCAGQNAGVLNLAGNTGTVTGWEMSTDGGTTWIALSNSTSSQGYNNLNVTTAFRTEVKNGVCPATGSAAAIITVDQASNAGTISANATVCETYNGGTLVLNGVNGNVTDWQMSSDNGATWTSLVNVTNQQVYSALTDTTWFISIAVNGVCVADTSIPAVITVIPKPNASFTKNDTCFGLPIKFTNTTTVTGGYVQLFTWDFADNNNSTAGSPTHTYADTGTYVVSLVALSNFGCLDTFTLATTVRPLPSVVFTKSGPTTFCLGDSVTISVPSDPNNTYLWTGGTSNDSLTVDTTGTWAVHITNSVTGCSNSDSLSTIVLPSLVADAGLADTISIGTSVTLNGSGGGNYSWTPTGTLDIPTIANPVASPTTTTMYYLTVTGNSGCTSTDSVKITVELKYDFEISTVITPNGDGFNDFWYIKNIEYYTDNEVTIFNRYGQKVFGMTGYDNTWAGTNGGAALPDGTYYYVLKFTSTDKSYNGGITVLRSK